MLSKCDPVDSDLVVISALRDVIFGFVGVRAL